LLLFGSVLSQELEQKSLGADTEKKLNGRWNRMFGVIN